MITIPCHVLHAASLFAAREDMRYYLNGVCVEIVDERTYDVVATNGHILFVSRQSIRKDKPDIHPSVPRQFILGRATLRPLAKFPHGAAHGKAKPADVGNETGRGIARQ